MAIRLNISQQYALATKKANGILDQMMKGLEHLSCKERLRELEACCCFFVCLFVYLF